MPREKCVSFLNLDDLGLKRRLLTWIGTLRGVYEVTIRPRKINRSNQANAFLWAAINTPLAEAMTVMGDVVYLPQDAHDYLKMIYAPKSFMDPSTGEVIRLPGDTHDMSVDEFSAYIEKCIACCARDFGLIVLTKEQWGWIPDKKVKVT